MINKVAFFTRSSQLLTIDSNDSKSPRFVRHSISPLGVHDRICRPVVGQANVRAAPEERAAEHAAANGYRRAPSFANAMHLGRKSHFAHCPGTERPICPRYRHPGEPVIFDHPLVVDARREHLDAISVPAPPQTTRRSDLCRLVKLSAQQESARRVARPQKTASAYLIQRRQLCVGHRRPRVAPNRSADMS